MMRFVLALLALAIPSVAFAAAPVPSNGIISSPGEYYLAADRTSTGTLNIQITANNVELDLNRKTVRCNPADPSTAATFGIKITGANVTVYDGAITGCFMGSHASGSSGNVAFLDIDYTGNTYIGAHGGTIFIGNVFDSIAGYEVEPYAIGINAPANGCYISGNTFRNLHRQPVSDPAKIGEGVGVLIGTNTTACTVTANWFENDALGPERDIGVWVAAGASANITDNSFTNFGWTVAVVGTATVSDNRFWMRDLEANSVAVAASTSATVTASGNVIIDFDADFDGPVADGGNLILP